MNEEQKDFKNHHMMIKNRESLDVTGIKKINGITQNEFVLDTIMGIMKIKGENLEMVNLNIDSGELSITGYVNSITYDEIKRPSEKKETIISKLFK